MDKEFEKSEEELRAEADYTGHSEEQLDLAVDNPMKKAKQDPGGKGQAIYQSNQNNTKTIYAKKKKQDD